VLEDDKTITVPRERVSVVTVGVAGPASLAAGDVVTTQGMSIVGDATGTPVAARLPFWDITWSGAVAYADGTAYAAMTDSSAAIASAITTAASLGVPVRGAGTYRVDATVTFADNCDFTGATFVCSNTALAPVVRAGSTSTTIHRKTLRLPRVVQAAKTAAGWAGASVGVELVNLNTCTIDVPYIDGFKTGLLLTTTGARGVAYCTVNLGQINQCQKNLHIRPGDASGWVNQNTFVGGRLSHNSTLEGTNVSGVRQIFLERNNSSLPNNNVFLGTSLEGEAPEYHLHVKAGVGNLFFGCRWEAAAPRVFWDEDDATYYATLNHIYGGYDSGKLVYTKSTNSRYNNTETPNVDYKDGVSTSAIVRWKNGNSNGTPALVIFGATGDAQTSSVTTDYAVRLAPNFMEAKLATDGGVNPRMRLDWINRRIDFGLGGSSAPDTLIERGGANLLTMGSGDAFRTGAIAALPTPSVTYRGYQYRIEGGTGVADGFYVCLKKADDTYKWFNVLTGAEVP
jgi:hypothetical protein